MLGKIIPLPTDKPSIFNIDQLYDADVPSNENRYIPPINSIVYGKNNYLYRVVESSYETLRYKLELINVPNDYELSGRALVVSYGNDVPQLYYDNRNKPYRCTVEQRVVVQGESPAFYRIVLNPSDDAKRKVISRYYDSTGKYLDDRSRMTRVSPDVNLWSFDPCFISDKLDDGRDAQVIVFNESGVQVATVLLKAKESIIINDSLINKHRIVNVRVFSENILPNGDIYFLERQDFNSVNIFAEVLYDDGQVVKRIIDDQKVFLYGKDDFVASFSGLQQKLLLKYFLSENEYSDMIGYDITNNFINVEFNVVVVNNEIDDISKISVIPYWDNYQNGWLLYYRLYGVNNNVSVMVTDYVKIISGKYIKNYYTKYQEFLIRVDLNKVDPIRFPKQESYYTQNVYIDLYPQSSQVKWMLSDAKTSDLVYGQDKSVDHRPVLHFDQDLKQFFIPTSLFNDKAEVIKSYYTNNSPPFDNSLNTSPQEPTHFCIRDAINGGLLTPTHISLDDYKKAFSLRLDTVNNYVNTTVVIEFVTIFNNTINILYGSPIDTLVGKYLG